MARVQLFVPDEKLKNFDAYAKRIGVSRTALFIGSVEKYIETQLYIERHQDIMKQMAKLESMLYDLSLSDDAKSTEALNVPMQRHRDSRSDI